MTNRLAVTCLALSLFALPAASEDSALGVSPAAPAPHASADERAAALRRLLVDRKPLVAADERPATGLRLLLAPRKEAAEPISRVVIEQALGTDSPQPAWLQPGLDDRELMSGTVVSNTVLPPASPENGVVYEYSGFHGTVQGARSRYSWTTHGGSNLDASRSINLGCPAPVGFPVESPKTDAQAQELKDRSK